MFGKTHTNETKALLTLYNKGDKNPMFGKTHTDETKLKIKLSLMKRFQNKKESKSSFVKTVLDKNKIGIFNENLELIETFSDGMAMSKKYNIPKSTLYRYLKTGKLYNKKYFIKKIIH